MLCVSLYVHIVIANIDDHVSKVFSMLLVNEIGILPPMLRPKKEQIMHMRELPKNQQPQQECRTASAKEQRCLC